MSQHPRQGVREKERKRDRKRQKIERDQEEIEDGFQRCAINFRRKQQIHSAECEAWLTNPKKPKRGDNFACWLLWLTFC